MPGKLNITAFRRRPIVTMLTVAAAVGWSFSGTSRASGPTDPGRPAVSLAVSMIWEGRHIQPFNIEAMQHFRETFTDLSIVHLISPAYFYDPAQAPGRVQALKSVLRPHDSAGITIAPWQSVLRAAGIPVKHGPTFTGHVLRDSDCRTDCGFEIPLSLFQDREVDAIVAESLRTLNQYGFSNLKAVYANGWLATPGIQAAFVRHGLSHDFSAVAPDMVFGRLGRMPLYSWVRGIWGNIRVHQNPGPSAAFPGQLTLVPMSIGPMAYHSFKEMQVLFREAADRSRASGEPSFFHLVIHQETAKSDLPMLEKVLQDIFATAVKNGISVMPADLGMIGQISDLPGQQPAAAPVSH